MGRTTRLSHWAGLLNCATGWDGCLALILHSDTQLCWDAPLDWAGILAGMETVIAGGY